MFKQMHCNDKRTASVKSLKSYMVKDISNTLSLPSWTARCQGQKNYMQTLFISNDKAILMMFGYSLLKRKQIF